MSDYSRGPGLWASTIYWAIYRLLVRLKIVEPKIGGMFGHDKK